MYTSNEPVEPSAPLPAGWSHALRPGTTVEDFLILDVLELTSFEVTYAARDPSSRNTVLLREYLPEAIANRTVHSPRIVLTDAAQAEAFQRGLHSFVGEALALSQFEHPNLLHTLSVWECNGTAYCTLPRHEGSSLLARRLANKVPPDHACVQALLDGLLKGLQALNDAGLTHGYVEPINIMMLDGDRPVLQGFDAVRRAMSSDMSQPFIDAYADTADMPRHVAADLYAVASVIHFAISGRWSPAIPGDGLRLEPLSTVVERLKRSAPTLDYPPGFLSAIDALLVASPSDWPRSVREFRERLAEGERPVVRAITSAALRASPATPRRAKVAPPDEVGRGTTQGVLAMLATFGRGPAHVAEGVEPFEAPLIPVLTDEAESRLPAANDALADESALAGVSAAPNPAPSGGPPSRPPRDRLPAQTGDGRPVVRWWLMALLLGVVAGAVGWHLAA